MGFSLITNVKNTYEPVFKNQNPGIKICLKCTDHSHMLNRWTPSGGAVGPVSVPGPFDPHHSSRPTSCRSSVHFLPSLSDHMGGLVIILVSSSHPPFEHRQLGDVGSCGTDGIILLDSLGLPKPLLRCHTSETASGPADSGSLPNFDICQLHNMWMLESF